MLHNLSNNPVMPSVTLRKALYDECIRHDEEPTDFVNHAVAEKLSEEHGVEVEA
jgi:hypothetical protein